MPNREIRRLNVKTVEGVRTKHLHQAKPGYVDKNTQEEKQKPSRKISKRLLIALGIIVGTILIIGAVLSWWAHGAVSSFVASGNQHLANKEISKAQDDYDLAIQLRVFNPQSAAEAFMAVGDILWKKNQVARALDYYREAAKNAPKNSKIALTAARALLSRNKTDEAAAILEKAPSDTPTLEVVGAIVELRKGNTSKAQNIFERAAEENDAEGTFDLWILSLIDGSVTPTLTTGAEGAAAKLKLTPQFTEIQKKYTAVAKNSAKLKAQPLVDLGNTLLQQQQPDFAAMAANTALKSDPQYRDAFTLLALSQLAVFNTTDAASTIQKSLAISPLSPELLSIQGRIFAAAGDVAQAENAYKKAAQLGQDSADFHFAFGTLLRTTDDIALAATELQKAYGARKDKLSYAQAVYFALLDADKNSEAQDVALEVIQNFPTQDFGYAARAFTGFKLNEDADTIQQNLNLANEKNTSSAFASYVAGVLLRDKQPDAAAEAFLQAIDWDYGGDVAKRANTELGILNKQI